MNKVFYRVRWAAAFVSGRPVSFGEFTEENEILALQFVKNKCSKERKWCKIIKVTEEEIDFERIKI